MGLDNTPEVKLARRILKKHSLLPPFDIKELLASYAEVHFAPIPIEGVDGVSINIKIPGKKPKVIVNTATPPTRQIFTMAHELGHLVIPWHIGTLIDDIQEAQSQHFHNYEYWEIEREANRFAAELLMPEDWIISQAKLYKKLADLHKEVCNKAQVSPWAASIRLISLLPPNIIYCTVQDGIIVNSGRSEGTIAMMPQQGIRFYDFLQPLHSESYSKWNYGNKTIHWWKFYSEINIGTEDERPWKEILDEITRDINPSQGPLKYKHSLNAVIAAANGKLKLMGNYSVSSIIAASYQTLSRPEYQSLVEHRSFDAFIGKKAEDLFNKKKKK